MGEVYRARDHRLGRTVVIKTLLPGHSQDPARKGLLLHEAKAAATVAHPGICTIHDIGEHDGEQFIVMEFVEGKTLDEYVSPEGVDLDLLIRIAIDAAAALGEAHRRRIIHRDIKPSNIMVTPRGAVKVLDLGLAQTMPEVDPGLIAEAVTASEAPASGESLAGTIAYMSPEQLRQDNLDGRSDLFSLGVVLYELASGRHPFRRPAKLSWIAAILSAAPQPIVQVRPDFPIELQKIIFRCLEKAPEHRYQRAEDLLDDLRRPGSSTMSFAGRLAIRPTIAVLPFANLGDDQQSEYFTDGITSEIILKLARQKNFLVISQTSTMQFKSADRDIREIGRQLGAQVILEGGIRRHGRRCRLTAQLIDVEDGTHLWAEGYDFRLDDIFEVQDRVSHDIAAQLAGELRLVEGLPMRIAERPREDTPPADENAPPKSLAPVELDTAQFPSGPTSLEAFEAYLRGKHEYYKFSSSRNLTAIDELRHSIELDPDYAKAYAALANVYLARVERDWETDPQHWIELAWNACQTAIRLDPGVSEAYSARGLISFFRQMIDEAESDAFTSLHLNANNDVAHNLLGRVHLQRGDFDRAAAAFEKAVEINPNYVWCLNDLAMAYGLVGRTEESERLLLRALELNPTDEGANFGIAVQYCLRGDMDAAMEAVQRSMDAHPSYPHVLPTLVLCLEAKGEHEEALDACREALDSEPGSLIALVSAGLAYACHGDRERLEETMQRALGVEAFYSAFNILFALYFAYIGEKDWAAKLVEKARQEGMGGSDSLQRHPLLQGLADYGSESVSSEAGEPK
jgi:non-specific serine/threonine protein kinase